MIFGPDCVSYRHIGMVLFVISVLLLCGMVIALYMFAVLYFSPLQEITTMEMPIFILLCVWFACWLLS